VRLEQDVDFVNQIQTRITNYVNLLDAVKLKDAIREAMALSGDGNKFMQENEPWRLLKEGKDDRGAAVMGLCVNLVYWLAILFEPFLPGCSQKILKQLNFGIVVDPLASDKFVCHIPAGHVIGEPEHLFRRLEDTEIEGFRTRYAGTQDQRNAEVAGPKFVLDVRVGQINKVEDHPHPEAPLLYVLSIDVGDEKERTVVSGLKPNFTAADLQGRKVLVVCNGKEFDFKGIVSTGMVLTAEKK
jgi:methionyl-tRNA synthetase